MSSVLTVVGVPKPFGGAYDTIQANAIRSWQELPLDKEILLLGDDSCKPVAKEVGATLITDVATDPLGIPLVNSIFAKARKHGEGDLICLVNSDIILLPELAGAIAEVRAELERFLLVTRRWNLDFAEELDFRPGWDAKLRALAAEQGTLFAPQAIDLFIFPRDLYGEVPPFAIGRSYYDNWLVDRARRLDAAVVDATDRAMIVHQNHEYATFSNIKEIRESPQGRRNFFLAGDSHLHIGTTRDATHRLTESGLEPTETRLVSVVIPHRGPVRRLHRIIRALSHQTYPRTFFEVVVVNNDPDASVAELASQYPHVKVCAEPKKGPAAARNYGAACAAGDILAFLDNDCLPTRDWIAEGVRELERTPGEMPVVWGEVEQAFSTGPRRSVAEAYSAMVLLQQKSNVENHRSGVTANMFVSRTDFWRIGGFAEEFSEAAGEDWDWAARARDAGATFRYSGTAKVLHPTVRSVAELRTKLSRLARGNAQLWHRRRAAGESDPQRLAAFGPPGLRHLRRRLRMVSRARTLSPLDRCRLAGVLIGMWPALRREWRSAAAEAGRQARG